MTTESKPHGVRLLRSRAGPLAAVVVLLGLKLSVLALFGPTMTPDSAGYIAYADAILSGSFLHVDFAAEAQPWTVFRPIGYPAVLAVAKIVTGGYWAWAVVLFQFAISICATAMIYRLARMFRLSVWVSLGVAAMQAGSLQCVLDQAILADSLCASIMTIVACSLAGIILRREAPSMLPLFGIGWLIAAAFLIKDVIAFLVVAFVPLAAAAVWGERSRLRRVAAFALIFIPLAFTHRAYVEWNRVRIGAPVVTTVSQAAFVGTLANASRYDPTIFSDENEVNEVARRVLEALGPNDDKLAIMFALQAQENFILHRDYDWDAVRISREVTAAYLRAWIGHPMAMVRNALAGFFIAQVHQVVRPAETIRDIVAWNTASDADYARAFANSKWLTIPAELVHRLAEMISVAFFMSFILLTPVRLVRDGLTTETSVTAGLWCAYLMVVGIYAAVQIDLRYLTPVVPGAIVVGAVNIAWLVAASRRRWTGKLATEASAEESSNIPAAGLWPIRSGTPSR